MAKTSQELVTRVMQKLTSLPPGEDPSAEDDQFITESWKTINAKLRRRKVSSFTYNSIPDEVFESLVDYVKETLWEEYHGKRDGNAQFVRMAERELRADVALKYMGNPVKALYY
jgi:hypothetical protein